MKEQKTYAGTISQNGAQAVKAPLAVKKESGKGKTVRGKDLRTGK